MRRYVTAPAQQSAVATGTKLGMATARKDRSILLPAGTSS
jgi:hypothetical protein